MSRKDVDSLGSRFFAKGWKHQLVWLIAAVVILTVVFQFRKLAGDRAALAKAPRSTQRSAPAKQATELPLPRKEHPQHDVMALVNGKDISRKDLINACVRRFGEDVLESLVNKRLIMSHCEARGITITQQEIAAEVDRMAKRFKLGREQWFEMLQKERGISPEEYARDIVWPTLALRKLAAEKVNPTAEEINKAYVRDFGEMVGARLIAVNDANLARQLQAKLTTNPESFARMAIEHSIDVNSASVGGLIQPIRHHVGDPAIESEAFQLQPGQISSVISVAGQHVILKCEHRIPPRRVNRAEVEQQIVEKLKDEKLRGVANDLFAQLQSAATTVNVYNNPRLRETMPGVVATVNGDRITMKQLGQECLLRHGEEVLETEISQLLLEQTLKRANLEVTEADLQAEVAHAAVLAGVVDEQGNANLEKWFAAITQEQGIEQKQYLRDSVWPSAALKKLTAEKVTVSEEDLQKGFEANYGQRVRCRAIVSPSLRRAQEVWDKARRNPSVQYFGDLAAEYSVEPTSKALRGEVPPLQRHGGQPLLEKAAFALQPDQLSGIVQVGDKFIILRAEGRTEQIDINLAQVRDILHNDIYEKKLRLAMSEKFDAIRENSRVDNYLAGTSHAPPNQAKVRQDSAVRQTGVQR
ncbi:MAG: peptidylprolyl isomerase [Planctomycetes bacterium]|nr:peptidylprolyl isomerase [Planctomycetota bacterium]